MKKLSLLLALLCLLTACAAATPAAAPSEASGPVHVSDLPTVTDTLEYTLYTNIFYNKTGDQYLGQQITKTGTFAVLRDSFNQVTRYYVWGYYDNTKCCDWQWEFVPKDPAALPPAGSFVTMTGTFAKDEAALDGYWFTDAAVEVRKIYDCPACDVDMGTMSATLERVQLINLQVHNQDYLGQTVRLYARVAGSDSLEHPYYDGAWQQMIESDSPLPAIGTLVLAEGTWKEGGVLAVTALEKTSAY